ncbi:hypothetical protein DFH09DRAFT_1076399 [Mycena vulgaris]|nr:hypothetical protein DFH09DRAFT_1076399 [Mycena vulgaris]
MDIVLTEPLEWNSTSNFRDTLQLGNEGGKVAHHYLGTSEAPLLPDWMSSNSFPAQYWSGPVQDSTMLMLVLSTVIDSMFFNLTESPWIRVAGSILSRKTEITMYKAHDVPPHGRVMSPAVYSPRVVSVSSAKTRTAVRTLSHLHKFVPGAKSTTFSAWTDSSFNKWQTLVMRSRVNSLIRRQTRTSRKRSEYSSLSRLSPIFIEGCQYPCKMLDHLCLACISTESVIFYGFKIQCNVRDLRKCFATMLTYIESRTMSGGETLRR